jgi:Glycosyltransferase family 9 (heptosyltransferase)
MSSRLVRPALFASTADASVLRDCARLLPYDRDSLTAGALLPTRDEKFLRALLAARSIYFDSSKTNLGDALLALAHLEALRDAARLFGLSLTVAASPGIARLLDVPAATDPPDGSSVICVVEGCKGALVPRTNLPTFCTATRVYADFPARRYLDVEQRLGVRLPRDAAFLPAFTAAPAPDRPRPLICYIAASSWPEKKDYGVNGFARVAQQIDAITGRDFDHMVIHGMDYQPTPAPPLRALPFESLDMPVLLGLFAQATLVIGNDTGLVHAAAMTKSHIRRGVIGIYGRHSYLRFTTGDPRHYAIATPFAQAMALSDRSPIPDVIDDEWYPRAAPVRRIAPEFIAECARRVLDQ